MIITDISQTRKQMRKKSGLLSRASKNLYGNPFFFQVISHFLAIGQGYLAFALFAHLYKFWHLIVINLDNY